MSTIKPDLNTYSLRFNMKDQTILVVTDEKGNSKFYSTFKDWDIIESNPTLYENWLRLIKADQQKHSSKL